MSLKVMLATRLPKGPDPVGREAARLAAALDAELVMLYVAEEASTVAAVEAVTGLAPDVLRERMLGEIRGAAEAYAERTLRGARVRVLVRTGDVVDGIVAAARQEEVDYLVIGTEGRSPLHEMIVGGTSSRVLRHAPCPVVVVPPAPHAG